MRVAGMKGEGYVTVQKIQKDKSLKKCRKSVDESDIM